MPASSCVAILIDCHALQILFFLSFAWEIWFREHYSFLSAAQRSAASISPTISTLRHAEKVTAIAGSQALASTPPADRKRTRCQARETNRPARRSRELCRAASWRSSFCIDRLLNHRSYRPPHGLIGIHGSCLVLAIGPKSRTCATPALLFLASTIHQFT